MFPMFLIALLLVGCVQSDGSVKVISDKPGGKFFSDKPIEFSKEEIMARQEKLRTINKKSDVGEKIDLTLVFEGKVIKKEYIDRRNAMKIKMTISKIVYGLKSKTIFIDIYTPLNKNGIQFEVGKKYKIAAVQKKLEYWTWAWMGTFAL